VEAVAPARPSHRKAFVIASRTVLLMLGIAAVVLLALGLAIRLLGDEPEVGGWLRAVFGQVFSVAAIGLAAVLGAPAAVGLWAMAGATQADAEPALSPQVRHVFVGIGVAMTVITAVVCVATGSGFAIVNLGLVGLVTLATLGLAGATNFSPHRAGAVLSATALVLVSLGALWVLSTVFLRTPAV
jgi:hypothetical protein